MEGSWNWAWCSDITVLCLSNPFLIIIILFCFACLEYFVVSILFVNKSYFGTNLRYGLIAQEVKEILPNIVNISYGQIDNINTEFNRNDIKKDYDKITLQLDNLDIQKDDKLEICDIDNEGITSNIRTVDIIEVLNNEFSFIDPKTDTTKNLFVSGKHVDDFKTIDYLAL